MNWYSPAQELMAERRIDGWLIYDFRNNNPVLAQLLGGKQRGLSRRVCLYIPRVGKPTLLTSFIDSNMFGDVTGCDHKVYITWQEFFANLKAMVGAGPRIAMEYVPGALLPVMQLVDAGTIELVRSFGLEVVSSADLVQMCIARWSPEARAVHAQSAKLVHQAKDDAFDLIRTAHRAGKEINEYQVQQFIVDRFNQHGLQYPDPPIVGVNAHGGDPHFEVSAKNPSPIKPGDWVLIDLWARIPGDHNIYSDITWTGFCGKEVPARHNEVFRAVLAGRDAAIDFCKAAWARKETIQGWQIDQACIDAINARNLGQFIRHRTGHSLSPGSRVHGIGVNIDNLETHDTRTVLPGVGFTIEPGLYLPEFGVRSEINMWINPQTGPELTSEIQRDPILIA